MKVSIIVPARNEASIIEENLKNLKRVLRKYDYEIIVSEDGSTDGTDTILENIAKQEKRIEHLHSKSRLGKGKALKNAFRIANGQVLLFIDADARNNFKLIPTYIEKIFSGYDVCNSSRYLKESKQNRKFARRIVSVGYKTLVKLFFNTKLTDFQCGFKAFSRRTVPILLKAKNDGYAWDTEILVELEQKKFKIMEMPVNWYDKDGSNLNVAKDSFIFFFDLVKIRLNQ